MIDRIDVLAFAGVLLLGAAVYLWWGVAAVLAYLGIVTLTAVAGVLIGHQILEQAKSKQAAKREQ